jgi:signal transduction histidine kinase/CheY-like chemotaxis protein/HAMP domain-containing protein
MTIRNKLLTGFGILLVIMFAVAGLGINRLTLMNESIGATYDILYSNVKDSQKLQEATNDIGRSMVTLMLNESSTDRTTVLENLQKNDQTLRKLFEEIRGKYVEMEQSQLTEQAIDAGFRYLAYKDRIVELMTLDRVDEAVKLRSAEGLKLQQEIQEKNTAFGNYHERRMDTILKDGSAENRRTLHITISLTLLGLVLVLATTYWIIQSMSSGLNMLSRLITQFSSGTIKEIPEANSGTNDEIGGVVRMFNRLAKDLEVQRAKEQEYSRRNEEEAWLKTEMAGVMVLLQGRTDLDDAGDRFVRQVAPLVSAVYAGLYIAKAEDDYDKTFELAGSYAAGSADKRRSYRLGQGLVGQCARENRWITIRDTDGDSVKIELTPGMLTLGEVLLVPIAYEEEVLAVLELGAVHSFTPLQQQLLEQISLNMGIVLHSAIGRIRVEELLRTSQVLTEELQAQSEELLTQQDELRMSYEKLEEQTGALRKSEELLQQQQEELAVTNEELTLKTTLLEEQVRATREKNKEVELANQVLERQALELEVASKYKSEFLANMSHELRTPLNSMMILSHLFQENKDGNLTPKQIEYAAAIHGAGDDLLRLIDDVLDLSKVEAGHMDMLMEPVLVKDVIQYVQRSFEPVAARKEVELLLEVEEGLPEALTTDSKRLLQIIGNLLSNAFKFTAKGAVTFRIARESGTWSFQVEDTGIGIPEDQLEEVFHAFRQADGTTSRNYGGTGLGLSISRQLSQALGGAITVSSIVGKGSIFTLELPELQDTKEHGEQAAEAGLPEDGGKLSLFGHEEAAVATEASVWNGAITDKERVMESLQPLPENKAPGMEAAGDTDAKGASSDQENSAFGTGKKILVVDDDIRNVFALSVALEECGMEVYFAENGLDALALLEKEPGLDMILMDIMMPRMDGYETMRAIRAMPDMKDLPIIAVTAKAMKDDHDKCMEAGASDYLTKPIDIERLLSLLKVWLYETRS